MTTDFQTLVGWTQVAFISAFWLAFIVRNLITRLAYDRSPIVFGRDTQGVVRVIEWSLPLFSAALIVEIVMFAQGGSLLPDSLSTIRFYHPLGAVLGLLLQASAVLMFIVASRQIKSSWRAGVDSQAADPLIRTGLFSMSRNPVYLAMFLFLGGTALVIGTLSVVAYAALGVGLIHFQVRQEEKALRHRFGDAYVSYCATVPRYLFRVAKG